MALSRAQRQILFDTPLLSRQMRKCVQARGSMQEQELRDVFSDIRSNQFFKTLRQLAEQKALVRSEGVVTFLADTAGELQGSQADRVWKAARLLGSFSLPDLIRISEVSWEYAEKLLLRWARAGYVHKVNSTGKGIWRTAPDLPSVRPVAGLGRDSRKE